MSEATNNPGLDLDPRVFDSEEFQRDPFPVYKQLRDYYPIYHDRFHNRWIVSRYWDVDACFQDRDRCSRIRTGSSDTVSDALW